jgi:hypothetical protein
MKSLATIKGENNETITLSYDETAQQIYADSIETPTTEVGPRLESEEKAAEWIQDSYGHTEWQLDWIG